MIYISIPTVIEALKWDNNLESIKNFLIEKDSNGAKHYFNNGQLYIKSTNNEYFVKVNNGFFVIKEDKKHNGFYPCSPKTFKKKYRMLNK